LVGKGAGARLELRPQSQSSALKLPSSA
jgi:hypothetical protein